MSMPESRVLQLAIIPVAVAAFALFIWGTSGGPAVAEVLAFLLSGVVLVLIWLNQRRHREG